MHYSETILLAVQRTPIAGSYNVLLIVQLVSACCISVYTLISSVVFNQRAPRQSQSWPRWSLCPAILLQLFVALNCIHGLFHLTPQRYAQDAVSWEVGLLAACITAAFSNIAGFLLGLPSTARCLYHLFSSSICVWMNAMSHGSITTSKRLFPWILALACVLDIFYTDHVSSRSAIGKLSYGSLSHIIGTKEPLSVEDKALPEVPSLTPSVEYNAALLVSSHTCNTDTIAHHIYWAFMLGHHRRELLHSTFLRLVGDLSLFAIPWQLQALLTHPNDTTIMAIFFSRLIGSLSSNYSGYHLRRIAVRYRSALSVILHDKTLRLGDKRLEAPAADLATLSEVDTMTLFRSVQTYTDIWILPFQLCLVLGGLAYLLPYQAFITVVVLVVSMSPVLSFILQSVGFWMASNMSAKDARARLLGEVLEHIQAIKMHSWESVFAKLVSERRHEELKSLQGAALSTAALVAYMQSLPSALTLAAFGIILLLRQTLTNELVFSAIMLFTMLNASLGQISAMAAIFQGVKVSTTRIHSYINLPEDKIAMSCKLLTVTWEWERNFSFTTDNLEVGWPNSKSLVSQGSFSVSPRSLTIVTGKMGSGKSTFLLALVRNLESTRSQFPRLKLAYVGQEPVMFSGSICDNILFGRPFDAQRYAQVIAACSLDADFQRLHKGDRTIISGSSTLSGGQCARVCLARAVYSRADVYILDDPLAAVDVQVSASIIRNLIGSDGILNDTTRIISSSDESLLSQAEFVYCIRDRALVPLASTEIRVARASLVDTANDLVNTQSLSPIAKVPHVGITDAATTQDVHLGGQEDGKPAQVDRQNPILSYMTSAKRFGWPFTISTLLLARLSSTLGTYILKTMAAHAGDNSALGWYLVAFGLTSLGQAAFFFLFVYLLYKLCIIPAASALHAQLTSSILSRDLSDLLMIPAGTVLNLFTNDVGRVDGSLNSSIATLAGQYVNLTISCGVLVTAVPFSAIFVGPLVVAGFYFQQIYLAKLRQLRHLDAATRAPLLEYLSEASRGRVQISTLDATSARTSGFSRLLEGNVRILWPLSCIDLWLGVRLEIIAIALQIAALCLLLYSSIDPGVLGFVMTYIFQVTSILGFIGKTISVFEADAVSITRIAKCFTENSNLGNESCLANLYSDFEPEQAWPNLGRIEFRAVSAQYRTGLPKVLRSVSFTVHPGEKVAVVGRTGAGKSSLILTILGLMEQTDGKVLIDDVDITDVSGVRLRRSLAVMPQRPIVFSGSIRQNLDPLGLRSDMEIMEVLYTCGLEAIIKKISNSTMSPGLANTALLDTIINTELPLSKGEVQVLLLARVMIQRSKVLILDEATSNMDTVAENQCQDLIFQHLHNVTTLAIMHRLELTLHYDKILVLDHGNVAEFGSPEELIVSQRGRFFDMVSEDSGLLKKAQGLFKK